jgi:hypothetical protein
MDPVRRTGQLIAVSAIVVCCALGWSRPARAQGDPEGDALVTMGESMENMMVGENQQALEKLESALAACEGKSCDASTRALVLIATGIVYGSGLKDLPRAKQIFVMALREDPNAQIDRQFATRETQEAFAAARAEVGEGPGTPPGATRLPPTREQLRAAEKAAAQLAEGDWSGCMQTIIGEMTQSDEFAAGRLQLARCQDKGGLLLEAGADAARAAELALAEGDDAIGAQARELSSRLELDTPSIVLVIPPSIDAPVVKLDEVVVETAAARKGIRRNPGKVTVEVTGKKGSYPFTFKTVERVDRGEKVTVDVIAQSDGQDSVVFQCILAAKTAEDVNTCIETGGRGRGLTFRGALEVSTYNDTDHTDVASPAIAVSLENPTSGWAVGGSLLVDVVSSASADIVATASRRFDQARLEAALGGDYRIDVVKASLRGGLSVESDYVGRAIGGSVSADLADKRVTPTLGYTLGLDTIGRDDTSFDEFSNDLTRHTIDASVSGVLDASTIALAGLTLQIESGDQSKPYRHIPLFSEEVAARVPRGATPEVVAAFRLPPTPLEQLPLDRLRLAVLLRGAHRFETMTLRADERVYFDDWGMFASTTDARLPIDLDTETRVGPHLRFHIQKGVGFWERAYVATPNPVGFNIPSFRTGDRELGPLFAVTAGAQAERKLTDGLLVKLQVDGIYTQFLDHIYIFDRLGVFTATTLELEVE